MSEGDFTRSGQRIGVIEVDGNSYQLVICFPALIDQLYAVAGASVSAEDRLLRWNADGDEIPYGRSYFRLEMMDA